MANRYEKVQFKSRKWLLDFAVGESLTLPVASCSYGSIRSTCSQLKTLGMGEWKVSKKHCLSTETRVTRIK